MTSWACLLLPSLALDVFARARSPQEAARPFVVSSGGHYPRVVAADAKARTAGIRHDQLVSGALALAPDLVLRERDARAEREALAQVATWMLTFTPMTCLVPPDAVVADIGGSLRLFGGLSRLVARFTAGAIELGYGNRLGMAPTPEGALLLARAGLASPVREIAGLAPVLAPLPLTLLDLTDATRTTLRDAGIVTFGEAAALPRDAAARRFGRDLVHYLDRILGRASDPRAPFVPPPRFCGRLELPVPVQDVDALAFGVQRLVRDLADWLLARGLGALRLSLTLVHEHYLRTRGLTPTVVTFALGAPARTLAHLSGVLRERLARVTLPAPVEAIMLESVATTPLSGRNLGLLPDDERERVEVPLVDRLRARLGDDAIQQLVPHAEHRPELAMRAVDENGSKTMRDRAVMHTSSVLRTTRDSSATSAGANPALPDAPRPLWLLAEPQPLGAIFETSPWILRDGPERIESGWWDGGDVRRDYFIADSPDGRSTGWIYRDCRPGFPDGDWYLHGIFA